MLAIGLQFTSGSFHATPWGRHVNEADVEWPPSPWRLARAMLSAWYHLPERDEAPMQELLAAMASSEPLYQLPPAVHAHSRHFMPTQEGAKEKRTLVFDAFARVDAQAIAWMVWPDVELSQPLREFCRMLLERIGYLGRAESWVQMHLQTHLQGEYNCVPAEHAQLLADPGASTSLLLLSPLNPSAYAEFRQGRLEKSSGPKKKAAGALDPNLPENYLAALSCQTRQLRDFGWSLPPAARPRAYIRARGLLQTQAPQRHQPAVSRPLTTMRFALFGRPLPRIHDALSMGLCARGALMSLAAKRWGTDQIPSVISGHDSPAGHRHAFWISEDADGDGAVDHLIIHAAGGFSDDLRAILESLQRLWTREGMEWQVCWEGSGTTGDLPSPLLKSSREFLSLTPYLHPWYVKKNFGIPEQLRRECRERGLPEPLTIEPVASRTIAGRNTRCCDFQLFRAQKSAGPDRLGSFLRLRFSEPVSGPLVLGSQCHFGLGLFEPC